jgi:Zn-dependent peptidase ImmA (M78 family)
MDEGDLAAASTIFDGRRLTQARHLRRKLKVDVAAEVGLTPAAIGQFERGVSRPRPATVARLALALGVPPAYFAARPYFAIAESEAHFRRLRSTSRRDRDEARAHVEVLAEFVAWLEKALHLPDPDIPTTELGAAPEAAAQAVRAAWSLGSGPVSSMAGLLERRGFIVARLEAGSDDVDAFSCWLMGRPFVLLTSNKTSPERSRFDAAHELGHVVQHHDAEPGDTIIESEAHRFAAEFLMPASSIRPELPTRLDWRRYLQLKFRWGTSLAALVRRSRDLDAITEHAYRRAMMEMGRRGWRTNEPSVGLEPETPELMRRGLELLKQDRGLDLADAARALQISLADTRVLASMASAVDERAVVVSP